MDYYDKIECPTFIIQGSKDKAVRLSENKKFYNKLKVKKKFLVIQDGDHQFRKITALNKSIVEATGWFNKYL